MLENSSTGEPSIDKHHNIQTRYGERSRSHDAMIEANRSEKDLSLQCTALAFPDYVPKR